MKWFFAKWVMSELWPHPEHNIKEFCGTDYSAMADTVWKKTLANEPYCRVGEKNFDEWTLHAADLVKKNWRIGQSLRKKLLVLMPACISDRRDGGVVCTCNTSRNQCES